MEPAPGALGTTAALLAALGSVAVLAALHLLAPHVRRLPLVPERVTGSVAGGVAVAYVFLHLLPELAEGNAELREVLGRGAAPGPLLELAIFLLALVGFLLFYGLERLAERRSGEHGGSAFALHVAAFGVYNAVIGYTLLSDWRTSAGFAVLFTLAMGLHFVLTDRGLEEHYGSRFDRWTPRLLLAGALVGGWALSVLAAPASSTPVVLATAFLAGSILLNVFKEEIPSSRRSHYGWFAGGVAVYAALMLLVTALAEPEREGEREAARAVAVPR